MPTNPPALRQALLVAGMHRSGTSALGGVLAALGAQAPKSLMPPTKDNPRGYWESTVLMRFNDGVLASAGSSWHDWARFNPDWLESAAAGEHLAALPRLLEEEFEGARLFFIKDPRICRLLPLWLRVLADMEVEPKVILPVRHPLEVVRSLEARNTFVSSRSMLIWLRHVLDAELDSRGVDRAFVHYSEVLKDWRTQMRSLSGALHVQWPKWSPDTEVAIDTYLSTGLRHHVETDEDPVGHAQLVHWVAAAFDALDRLVDDGRDMHALAMLDEVRSEFDRASEVFATVARESELRAAREGRQREREAADASQKLSASEEQLRQLTATHQEQLGQLAAAHQEQLRQLSARHAAEVAELTERMKASEQGSAQAVAAAGEQLRQLSARHAAEVAELSTRMQASEQAHSQTLATSVRQQAELSDLSARLKESEHKAEALVTELIGVRAEVVSRDQRLHDLIAELAEAHRGKEDAAAGRDMELAERFGEIAALTRMLAEKEHAVAQADAERRALTLGLEKHKVKIATLEKALRGTKQAAAAKERELQSLQVQRAEQDQALALRERNLAALQSSTSWRLTAPFRRLGNLASRRARAPASDGDLELVRGAELFDAGWYIAANPDVAAAGMDPVEHYLLHGAYEGRDPGPRFASRRYLETYPDVAAMGMNPLVHYLRHGRSEGRSFGANGQP